MEKKFLIIGYGNIAKRHITNIKEIIPKSSIDVLRKRNSINVNQYVNNFYFNKNDINKFDYDFVFICSNTNTHIIYLNLFSDTKAKVFVEKPILNKNKDIKETKSYKESYKKNITVGYVLRFHPLIIKLKKFLDMNFIGNIIDIEFSSSSFVKFWNRSKNKNLSYLDLKKGGGAINELSHEIDLVTYLFDFIKIKKVFETKKIFRSNVEEGYKLFGEVKSKAKIFLNINFNCIEERRVIIIKGERGQLIVNLLNNEINFLNNNSLKIKRYTSKEEKNLRYKRQLNYFFRNYRNSSIFNCDFDNGIKVSKILNSIREKLIKQ